MGYLSRQPMPNEPEKGNWPYGPQEPHDDFSVLLNFLGKRCQNCRRVTMNQYLDQGLCPDCRREQ